MIINNVKTGKPANLLCTESELLFKEVECDISLPSAIASNYTVINGVNSYNIWDILYYDGKVYMLTCHNGSKLELHIYDGGTWSSVIVESLSSSDWNQYYKYGSFQELNGEIYFAYVREKNSYKLCKYENGAITEINKVTSSNNIRCHLIKDYENNILYWVRSVYDSSGNNYNYYQSFDGETLGNSILWFYGSQVYLHGAYIKNNRLYIGAKCVAYGSGSGTSASVKIFEVNLTNTSDEIRYTSYNIIGESDNYSFGLTKKIRDEYLSVPYNYSAHHYIYQNIGSTTGFGSILCGGIAFAEYEDGILICDVKQKNSSTNQYKSLKKIKLYKKLYTYAKRGDILQVGEAFAITDNLQQVDEHTYEVTADGKVEIGLYL
jgi:hypothetical protein